MKKTLLSVIEMCMCIGVYADVLSPDQALQRVMPQTSPGIRCLSFHKAELVAVRNAGNQPAVYLFTPARGEGFAMVSADDCVTPLLAYSNHGIINRDSINPTLEWWLSEYTNEIKWLRETMQAAGMQTANHTNDHAASSATRNEIQPMITSKWDQSAPYNNACPRNGNIACMTGCTATAMAQVVRYHHLPLTKNAGKASVTYNGTTYSYDFNSAKFNWDNMLDTYTPGNYTAEQAVSVADLMFACGVSVETNYSTTESTAYDGSPAMALPKYFGFNKACVCKLRDTFTLDTWIDLIYRQLSEYGPVIYGGQSRQGGHAFVCDGYSTGDFFHINWGWGGFSDGYFKLTALDPYMNYTDSGAYNYASNQSAVVNICSPDIVFTTTYSMMLSEPLGAVSNDTTSPENRKDIESIQLGKQFKLAGFPVNTSNTELTGIAGYAMIKKNDPNYTNNQILQVFSNLGMNQALSYLPLSLKSMTAGDYMLVPIWRNITASEWNEYDIPVNNPHYINVRVANGTAYFSIPEHKLTVEVVNVDTPLFNGAEWGFTLHVSNHSDGEYSGKIHAVLTGGNSSSIVATGTEIPFDLIPGDMRETSYITTFMPVSRSSLTAGNYSLCFVDDRGRTVAEPYDLTVENMPVLNGKPELQEFRLNGNNETAYRNNLDFNSTITSRDGYFIGHVEVGILDENLEISHGKFSSKTLYISDNQSSKLKIKGAIPDLQSGTKYAAVPYVTGIDGSIIHTGEPIMFVASDTEIPTDINNVENSVSVISCEIYNLQGIRVDTTHPLKGIYIVHEHMTDGTSTVIRRIFR